MECSGARQLSESDQSFISKIGVPVLSELLADAYFGLIIHGDSSYLEDSVVEKRLIIDMVEYLRTCAERYLEKYPESGFSVDELINLCACDLRAKGLVKPWVDSALAKGPIEPTMLPAGSSLYRVFEVPEFQIEGEVIKVAEEQPIRQKHVLVSEEEISRVFEILRSLNETGEFKTVNKARPQILEDLSITRGRLDTILRKLSKRGQFVNKGNDAVPIWVFGELRELKKAPGEPVTVETRACDQSVERLLDLADKYEAKAAELRGLASIIEQGEAAKERASELIKGAEGLL